MTLVAYLGARKGDISCLSLRRTNLTGGSVVKEPSVCVSVSTVLQLHCVNLTLILILSQGLKYSQPSTAGSHASKQKKKKRKKKKKRGLVVVGERFFVVVVVVQ